MNKVKLITLGLLSLTTIIFANPQNNYQPQGEYIQEEVQQQAPIKYQEPTTGVEIIFAQDGCSWDKIMANGESELIFGDRRDVRQSTSKAIMRAKASIAKFLKEKLNTTETIEEITKTIANSKNNGGKTVINAERKTVETLVENISSSAEAILKGVIVLEQNINQKNKYVSVKIGMSRKTMRTADNMSNAINRDLSERNNQNNTYMQQYNNGQNQIRRSRNYDNF